jgi:hypothetical protein
VCLVRSLLLLLLALDPADALAQFDSTTVFGRLVNRRFEQLVEDPAFLALNTSGGVEAIDWDNIELGTLDDPTLVNLFRMVGVALRRMTPEQCTRALSSGEMEMMMIMGSTVPDSVEAEEWADMMEQVFWAGAMPGPMGTVAPPDQVAELAGKILLGLPLDTRRLMVTLRDQDDSGSTCAVVPMVLGKLSAGDPALAAPMIRGLMSMGEREAE